MDEKTLIKLAKKGRRIREQADRKEKAWWDAHDRHIDLLLDCEPLIPKPSGMLWWRRCPSCQAYVKRLDTGEYLLYSCTKCDYEYAISTPIPD